MFKTNLLTVRSVVEKMIFEADMERKRLDSKLTSSEVTEYRSTKSIEEAEQEKAEWIKERDEAETDMQAAPVGSREKRRAELTRNSFQVKLDELEFEEGEETSDPKKAIRAAISQRRTVALLGVQVELLAELNDTLDKIINPRP